MTVALPAAVVAVETCAPIVVVESKPTFVATLVPLVAAAVERVKVVGPVIELIVAPLGMLALPLIFIPGSRKAVEPAVSVTLALPAEVVSASGAKVVATPVAVAVAALDSCTCVLSMMLVITVLLLGIPAFPVTGMPM